MVFPVVVELVVLLDLYLLKVVLFVSGIDIGSMFVVC
jgi:hypothetical protein